MFFFSGDTGTPNLALISAACAAGAMNPAMENRAQLNAEDEKCKASPCAWAGSRSLFPWERLEQHAQNSAHCDEPDPTRER